MQSAKADVNVYDARLGSAMERAMLHAMETDEPGRAKPARLASAVRSSERSTWIGTHIYQIATFALPKDSVTVKLHEAAAYASGASAHRGRP